MYFKSRAEAGAKLASELIEKYRYDNTAVIGLSDGGMAVAYQIAVYLHAALRRLPMEVVHISDESIDYATVLPGGVVAVNSDLTQSEQSYYYSEYAGMLEEELRMAASRVDHDLDPSEISPENLRGYNVILVDDGINSSTAMEAALTWLKPARVEKLILATPLISTDALDKAHVLMDELHILSVVANYITTSHYYDEDDIPDETMVKRMLDACIVDWC